MKYRVMGIDIETLPPESGRMPTADKDPCIIVSLSFDPPYVDNSTIILTHRSDHGNGETLTDGILYYHDEESMLYGLLDVVKDYDPDVICTYNGNAFDFPYLDTRMKLYSIFNTIGRNNRGWQIREQRVDKITCYIPGRIVIDLLPMVRKHVNSTEIKGLKPLKQYNLGYVAHELLDIEKGDVKASQMRGLWLGDKWMDLIAYARRDAELNIALLNKLNLLDRYIALSKASGVLLQDAINGGQTTLIDSLILREFKIHNRVVPPRKDWDDESSDEVLYEGAKVLDPIVGLHEGIIIMDFASLYPSIMRAYNLSPDTMTVIDGKPGFTKEVKGIVPGILERLYNERVAIKKEMKQETNKDRKNLLNAKQYAIKILLNSIYGFFGYTKSRLFEVAIASKVTEVGRDTIINTKGVAENVKGCVVIGGDTDSIFVRLPRDRNGFEDAKSTAKEISEKMGEILPDPMSLAFEAYGAKGLFLAKKRYAVRITEDGKEYTIKMRGIETRRRDWTEYTEETLSKVLDMLLINGDIKGAASYAMDQIYRIANLQSVSDDPDLMKKLLLSKKYSKPAEEYKTRTAHMEALKRYIEHKGEGIALGDRIPYYICDGRSDRISDRSEVADYVLMEGSPVSIDKHYYINKQLIPPLERIFEVLKFNLRTGKFNAKQLTWGDLDMDMSKM